MEQSAERRAMNTFLRQRILDEPPTPHTPVTLKSALLTFTPEPRPGHHLPHEHRDTCRNHDEEHHAHPWRDVAEHFARGVIHVGHPILGLGLANRFDELWDDLIQVAYQGVRGHLKDRRVWVF